MNWNEDIIKRHPRIIGEEVFRKYAVLIPLIEEDGTWYIVFEKRTDKLRKHPGEICFPGGRLEEKETYIECAIRETMEELLVKEEQIKVICPADIFLSPFQIMVHPFLALLSEYKNSYSEDEVAKIIKIPLEFFTKEPPKRYTSKLTHQPPDDFPYEWIPGGEDYPWIKGDYHIYFYKYEEYIIWGMTAHMIQSTIELLKEYKVIK